jgi:ribonuclease E
MDDPKHQGGAKRGRVSRLVPEGANQEVDAKLDEFVARAIEIDSRPFERPAADTDSRPFERPVVDAPLRRTRRWMEIAGAFVLGVVATVGVVLLVLPDRPSDRPARSEPSVQAASRPIRASCALAPVAPVPAPVDTATAATEPASKIVASPPVVASPVTAEAAVHRNAKKRAARPAAARAEKPSAQPEPSTAEGLYNPF